MIGRDQAKLALLTGVGLAYPDELPLAGIHAWKPDLRFDTSQLTAVTTFFEVAW
jgi:hypothetical protein